MTFACIASHGADASGLVCCDRPAALADAPFPSDGAKADRRCLNQLAVSTVGVRPTDIGAGPLGLNTLDCSWKPPDVTVFDNR